MKRIDISEYSLENYANKMYINLKTKKVYMYQGTKVFLVRNIRMIKDIFNHLISKHKKYRINKDDVLSLIFEDDKLNFKLL